MLNTVEKAKSYQKNRTEKLHGIITSRGITSATTR